MVATSLTETVITRPQRRALTVQAFSIKRELQLSTEWLGAEVIAVVSVQGDVDAATADSFLHYVLRKALLCRELVLDLSAVTFFSTAGHAALLTLANRCAMADVKWTVVPSRPVSRILSICDVARRFPIAGTVDDALRAASD